MNEEKQGEDLLVEWDAILIDLERNVHEDVEKARKRLYDLKLEFAKRKKANPIQVDFDEGSRTGKPDRD